MLVPPKLRNMLLLRPNLVKEIEHGSIYGQKGEKIRALGDCVQKYASRSLSVLDTALWKTIRKILGPV